MVPDAHARDTDVKWSEAMRHLEAGYRVRLSWMGVALGQTGRYSIARVGDDFRFENGTTFELDAEDCFADDWELAGEAKMEIKSPWICAACGHIVQFYFDGTATRATTN